MVTPRCLLAPALLLCCAVGCDALGRSLADCNAIASKFKNTCDKSAGAASSVAAAPGQTVSCSGGTWQRKLCVTCRESGGTVRIRVQSNGMPASCYTSPQPVYAQDNDFEVDFNPPATLQATPSTQAEVNQLVCDIQAHSRVPAASNYIQYGTSRLNVVGGISVDGVAYMNQMSAEGVDPFFPSVYGSVTNPDAVVERVDLCLGHPQAAGVYHYHTMSPCVADAGSQREAPCNAQNGCTDKAAHMISGYPKELMVIGIAKDGHVMYGPYLANGKLASEHGLDVCNGATGVAECDDSYAYFATTTFPYLSGCFGAGGRPAYTPQCTANGPAGGRYTTADTSSCAAVSTLTPGGGGIVVTAVPSVPVPTPLPGAPSPVTPVPQGGVPVAVPSFMVLAAAAALICSL